jgi:hypothetical protein
MAAALGFLKSMPSAVARSVSILLYSREHEHSVHSTPSSMNGILRLKCENAANVRRSLST